MDERGFKSLAREYYETAVSNFNAAKTLLREKFFSEAVFFTQQTVEKIAKAILALAGQTVAGHEVSGWLALEIGDKVEEPRKIIQIVSELESYVTKSQYPFRIRNKIISPKEFFTEERTRAILKKAEFAFKKLEMLLRERYGLGVK